LAQRTASIDALRFQSSRAVRERGTPDFILRLCRGALLI
jgi:hypothetical protein